MTISEVISKVDSLKPNTFSTENKVDWIAKLDGKVKSEIIDNHEGAEEVTFTSYDASTDLSTELLVPAPYDEMYLRWVEAQIDYYNGEYSRYNNAMAMCDTDFNSYKRHYTRTHMPISKGGWNGASGGQANGGCGTNINIEDIVDAVIDALPNGDEVSY